MLQTSFHLNKNWRYNLNNSNLVAETSYSFLLAEIISRNDAHFLVQLPHFLLWPSILLGLWPNGKPMYPLSHPPRRVSQGKEENGYLILCDAENKGHRKGRWISSATGDWLPTAGSSVARPQGRILWPLASSHSLYSHSFLLGKSLCVCVFKVNSMQMPHV